MFYKWFEKCQKSIPVFILGSVVTDTMKFAFLFFEFYIPYVVGFWIVFGGPDHAAKIRGDDENTDPNNCEKFNYLMLSVWSVSVIVLKIKIKMSVLRFELKF